MKPNRPTAVRVTLCTTLPFIAIRQGSQVQVNGRKHHIQWPRQRAQLLLQKARDPGTDFSHMYRGDFIRRSSTADGIRIGSTTHRHQRNHTWVASLNTLLGITRPIPTDPVVRKRRAVARVAQIDRSQLPGQIFDDQDRQIMVNWTSLGATIPRK